MLMLQKAAMEESNMNLITFHALVKNHHGVDFNLEDPILKRSGEYLHILNSC